MSAGRVLKSRIGGQWLFSLRRPVGTGESDESFFKIGTEPGACGRMGVHSVGIFQITSGDSGNCRHRNPHAKDECHE